MVVGFLLLFYICFLAWVVCIIKTKRLILLPYLVLFLFESSDLCKRNFWSMQHGGDVISRPPGPNPPTARRRRTTDRRGV